MNGDHGNPRPIVCDSSARVVLKCNVPKKSGIKLFVLCTFLKSKGLSKHFGNMFKTLHGP